MYINTHEKASWLGLQTKTNKEYSLSSSIYKSDNKRDLKIFHYIVHTVWFGLPLKDSLIMMFPIECPTKLSLQLHNVLFFSMEVSFFFMKAATSSASLCPRSLKLLSVLSSLISNIKHSAFLSIKSHWLRTNRRSRWCPWGVETQKRSYRWCISN